MNQEKKQPKQQTVFTIPADKIKITGEHVYFALYANGAKTGDLCMSQPEFKIFQTVVLDDTLHANNFDLGMRISELHNFKRAGWKILSMEHLKFWNRSKIGYARNVQDAGDFSFELAKEVVEESNKALHSEESKLVGAEELLIYHPSTD